MAIRMLGRRDHSEQEVRSKLRQKSKTLAPDVLDEVVQSLVESGLLSDTRFAEMLVRSRVSRGYGPYYIRQELSMKGIDAEFIDEYLATADVEWLDVAKDLVERRHACAQENAQAWGKAARFLQRRGFGGDVVAKVLGGRPRESL